MSRLLVCSAVVFAAAASALAQNPAVRKDKERNAEPARETPWSRVVPTESMWMYEQNKRDYVDTQLAMRRRAEYNAWQRRYRMAHSGWHGYSNSRPTWNPTPFTVGVPSPSWTGNDVDPNRWHAVPAVVVRPQSEAQWK
jgi:hypothetical protein